MGLKLEILRPGDRSPVVKESTTKGHVSMVCEGTMDMPNNHLLNILLCQWSHVWQCSLGSTGCMGTVSGDAVVWLLIALCNLN